MGGKVGVVMVSDGHEDAKAEHPHQPVHDMTPSRCRQAGGEGVGGRRPTYAASTA